MQDFRTLTPLLIVGMFLGGGMLDWILNERGGNQSTISRVLLAVQANNEYTAGLMCYAFAGLMVHLFWPTAGPFPPTWALLLRAMLFLAPVAVLMLILVRTNPVDVNVDHLCQCDGLYVVRDMVVGAFLGAVMAKLLVPQHIQPG